jgi:Kef-type K+ transport system membrane component KefB
MDTLVNTRLRETLYGTVVIEIMAVQDLFMAPLLAVPTALSHIAWQQSPLRLLQTFLFYAAGIVAVVVAARFAVPRFMQILSNPESSLAPQLFTLAISAYCLGFSLLFEWLELSHEAGALFAGLVLMDTPHVQKAAQAVEPLTSLFGGMYLASLGMIMSPTFLLNHLSVIMSYVIAIYILKVAVVTCVMRSFGFTVPAALSAGVVLAQVSEVSLFFIARSQQLGLVSRSAYLLMLATTVTLLAVAPLASNVVKRVDKREFSSLEAMPASSPTATPLPGVPPEREKRPFWRRISSVFFTTIRGFITWPIVLRRRNDQRGV